MILPTFRLRVLRAAFGLIVAALAVPVSAHEIRPAYLHITQTSETEFDVAWKEPVRSGLRLALQPVLPGACEALAEPRTRVEPDNLTQQWQIRCPDGLSGEIRVDGLTRTLIDAFVRIEMLSGDSETAILKPNAPTFEIGSGDIAVLDYLWLGVEHLIFGIDHVLFVLGLMYVVRGLGALVRTVTAFTVAHSITLALSALDVVTVPSGPVEAIIALSIVFLAAEAWRDNRESLAFRMPWLVAFGFGLLHGFGFAGALAELGLPQGAAAAALFLFNVGVELGQLALIIVLLALVRLWRLPGLPERTPRLTAVAINGPVLAMGAVAAFWTAERVALIIA